MLARLFFRIFFFFFYIEFYLSLIKDIERENPKILVKDHVPFFHTMRWFLEYFSYEKELANRKKEQEQKKQQEKDDSFNSGELFLPRHATEEGAVEGSGRTGGLVGETITATLDQNEQGEEEPTGFDYDQVASAMDLRAFMVCLRWMRTAIEQKVIDIHIYIQMIKTKFINILYTYIYSYGYMLRSLLIILDNL